MSGNNENNEMLKQALGLLPKRPRSDSYTQNSVRSGEGNEASNKGLMDKYLDVNPEYSYTVQDVDLIIDKYLADRAKRKLIGGSGIIINSDQKFAYTTAGETFSLGTAEILTLDPNPAAFNKLGNMTRSVLHLRSINDLTQNSHVILFPVHFNSYFILILVNLTMIQDNGHYYLSPDLAIQIDSSLGVAPDLKNRILNAVQSALVPFIPKDVNSAAGYYSNSIYETSIKRQNNPVATGPIVVNRMVEFLDYHELNPRVGLYRIEDIFVLRKRQLELDETFRLRQGQELQNPIRKAEIASMIESSLFDEKETSSETSIEAGEGSNRIHGILKDGALNGAGSETINHSKYIGEFINGRRSGMGREENEDSGFGIRTEFSGTRRGETEYLNGAIAGVVKDVVIELVEFYKNTNKVIKNAQTGEDELIKTFKSVIPDNARLFVKGELADGLLNGLTTVAIIGEQKETYLVDADTGDTVDKYSQRPVLEKERLKFINIPVCSVEFQHGKEPIPDKVTISKGEGITITDTNRILEMLLHADVAGPKFTLHKNENFYDEAYAVRKELVNKRKRQRSTSIDEIVHTTELSPTLSPEFADQLMSSRETSRSSSRDSSPNSKKRRLDMPVRYNSGEGSGRSSPILQRSQIGAIDNHGKEGNILQDLQQNSTLVTTPGQTSSAQFTPGFDTLPSSNYFALRSCLSNELSQDSIRTTQTIELSQSGEELLSQGMHCADDDHGQEEYMTTQPNKLKRSHVI